MPFKKGRQKTAGRTAGTPNKDTQAIKELLLDLLDKRANRKQWDFWRPHKDPHIAFEAFKLANCHRARSLSTLLICVWIARHTFCYAGKAEKNA